jgi:hypothetical protein
MNNTGDNVDHDSLNYLITGSDILDQAVGRSDRTAVRKITQGEAIMRTHGYATVWGAHGEVRHSGVHAGGYHPLKAWWAARQAARRQAYLATLEACWDAQHETVRPLRVEAALDLAAARGALTVATMLYGLQP